MTREKYTISRSPNRWHPSVKGINFDPTVYPDELEGDQEGTIYLQRMTDGPTNRAGLWMLGAHGGPGSPPVAMELSPQNAVNVVALGADNQGRIGAGAAINRAIQEAKNRGYCRVYLPAGYYLIDETIVMDDLIWIQGDGMATYLRAKDALNAPIFQAYYDPGERWGYMQRLSDLRIDGNRDGQSDPTGTVCHGIEWIAPDGATAPILVDEKVGYPYVVSLNYPGQWFDSNRDAFNLWISHCAGAGIWMTGRGGGHFQNITAYENQGDGFRPTYDTGWVNCTAGRNGKRGFYIADSAIRLMNCKAWWSGFRPPSSGWNDYQSNGFSFESNTRGAIAVGCEAQDNYANGFSFAGVTGHNAYDCIADSNNRRNGDSVAVSFYNSYNCRFSGQVYDRYNDSVRYQDYALLLIGSYNNQIDISHRYYNGGAATTPNQFIQHLSPDCTSLQGNTIFINNQRGFQKSSSGTVTISVYHGGDVLINLSANTTINYDAVAAVVPGARLRFMFVQDGTGSRTVTFSSLFRLKNFVVDATANKTSCVEFIYNDELDKWIEASTTLGV